MYLFAGQHLSRVAPFIAPLPISHSVLNVNLGFLHFSVSALRPVSLLRSKVKLRSWGSESSGRWLWTPVCIKCGKMVNNGRHRDIWLSMAHSPGTPGIWLRTRNAVQARSWMQHLRFSADDENELQSYKLKKLFIGLSNLRRFIMSWLLNRREPSLTRCGAVTYLTGGPGSLLEIQPRGKRDIFIPVTPGRRGELPLNCVHCPDIFVILSDNVCPLVKGCLGYTFMT